MTEPVIRPAMEQQSRLQAVIFEMQETVDDLLEKGLFALTGLMETMDRSTWADIAQDYILQAQKVIEDIAARECNDSEQQAMTDEINNKDDLEDRRQEIMNRIQKIRNPELLTKILTYVKSWTDDEGGISDE